MLDAERDGVAGARMVMHMPPRFLDIPRHAVGTGIDAILPGAGSGGFSFLVHAPFEVFSDAQPFIRAPPWVMEPRLKVEVHRPPFLV